MINCGLNCHFRVFGGNFLIDWLVNTIFGWKNFWDFYMESLESILGGLATETES